MSQHKPPKLRFDFTPSQPTVSVQHDKVNYREYTPTPLVADFIYCFWQLHSHQPLATPFTYQVVADGCIDIFFELSNPVNSWIMGISESHIAFELTQEFNYFGLRFFPSMFSQLFDVDAETLSNQFQQLSLVQQDVAEYISNSIPSESPAEFIIKRFEVYFEQLIKASNIEYDSRLYDALLTILKHGGCYEIEKLNSGLSPRQLRRLFKYYIGSSPKAFSKIVRFQHILRAKPSQHSSKQSQLHFLDSYFDQAHFIREFKAYYGKTPKQAQKDWQ